MKIEAEFISGGCNPIYNCLDVYQETLIYGCSNQIFVADFRQQRVLFTLPAHKKQLKTCRFLRNFSAPTILSSSASGEVFTWRASGSDFRSRDYSVALRHQMRDSVQFVESLALGADRSLVVAGDIEGEVVLAEVDATSWSVAETIRFGKHHVVQCAALARAGDYALVALGSLDFLIHVYAVDLRVGAARALHFCESLTGHVNAIQCVAFREFSDPRTERPYWILASGSRDSYVRLFRVQDGAQRAEHKFEEANSYELVGGLCATLESVLVGHQDAVVSVDWGLRGAGLDPRREENYALLSASFDFQIVLWSREQDIWMNRAKLGQLSGNKHAFFHAVFVPEHGCVLAYTYTGQFCLWRVEFAHEEVRVRSLPSLTGHTSYVTDLDWSSRGEFIVSCSQDQTSRLFAQHALTRAWSEFARPQVHGYDFNSVKLLRVPDSAQQREFCDVIVSAADEKIIRLCEPPAECLNLLNNLCGTKLRLFFPENATDGAESLYLIPQKLKEGIYEYKTVAEGGAQVLGLMTKQVKVEKIQMSGYHDPEEIEERPDEEEEGNAAEGIAKPENPDNYAFPPTDDHLARRTLWPELNKLYGHGFEISCVSADHKGNFLPGNANRKESRIKYDDRIEAKEKGGLIPPLSTVKVLCE